MLLVGPGLVSIESKVLLLEVAEHFEGKSFRTYRINIALFI